MGVDKLEYYNTIIDIYYKYMYINQYLRENPIIVGVLLESLECPAAHRGIKTIAPASAVG